MRLSSSCGTVLAFVAALAILPATASAAGWSIQPVPNQQSPFLTFPQGESCLPSGACMAVGYYQDTNRVQHLFAEFRAGTTWTVQSVPVPTGAQSSCSTWSASIPAACRAIPTSSREECGSGR